METKIKPYVGKIVKNGNAYHLYIPAHIRKYMELEKGDKLKVELTLVEKDNAVSLIIPCTPIACQT